MVKLVIDLEEKLAAFSTQRDADGKRIVELEAAAGQAAARQAETAAQYRVLQQDLAAAQVRIGELEQRRDDSQCETQQPPEGERAHRSRPVVRRESMQGAPEMQTDDRSTQAPRHAVPSVHPVPSPVRPSTVVSGPVEPASTTRPKRPPLDLKNATVRRSLAKVVVRWVEREATAQADGSAGQTIWINIHRGRLELISESVVAELTSGPGSAAAERELLPKALTRIREIMRREHPKKVSTFDEWSGSNWTMLMKVVQATVQALQDLRDQDKPDE